MKSMGKRKRSGSFSKTEDGGGGTKKSSDADDSHEDLDSENNVSGSTKGTAATGGGTRCSARVQEKQEKLRRESSPSKQIVPLEVCTTPLSVTNLVTYVLANKGLQPKNPSPNNETVSGGNDTPNNAQNTPVPEEKRKKRTWELWSADDKQTFFEALNEVGKDFDSIHFYVTSKAKSRKPGPCAGPLPITKNKDQVRHFYYRSWNKISKLVRFPEGMKKADQELYGLINYGELRKKQRILNSKNSTKFKELVENGQTSIKFRGKTCRVKTPVCNALKKLNGLYDIEHTRVPHKVTLEFIPKDGKTWRTVQSMSNNPRVKSIVPLQQTFASVISFLETKWKRQADRLKEQFSSVFGKPKARLRAIPTVGGEFSIPLFRVAENTSSATICLNEYAKKVLKCSSGIDDELSNNKRKRKQSGGQASGGATDLPPTSTSLLNAKRLDVPIDPETSDAESQSAMQCSGNLVPQSSTQEEQLGFLAEQSDENATSMKYEMFQRHLQSVADYDPVLNEVDNPVEDNLVPTETDNEETEPDLDEAVIENREFRRKTVESDKFISHAWDEEQIRRGWTADEAGVMTIGELYLMLGQTEKLVFEYAWDGPDSQDDARSHNLLDRLIATAMLLKKKKTTRSKSSTSAVTCGSEAKCSKCGSKIEIPANPSCFAKTCNGPNTTNNGGASSTTRNSSIPISRNRASTIKEKQKPSLNTFNTMDLSPMTVGSPNASGLNRSGDECPRVTINGTDPKNINRNVNVKSETVNQTALTYQESKYTFESSDVMQDGVATVNQLCSSNTEQNYPAQSYSNYTGNSNETNEGLVELCSLATNSCKDANISSHVKAASCMIRNPSGSITMLSQPLLETGQMHNKEQITFHRPSLLRSLEPAIVPRETSAECPPPKPFLDLPKGNRRLGRRPNIKRVVIPRVLPLLPKNQTLISVVTSCADSTSSVKFSQAALVPAVPVANISLGTEISKVKESSNLKSIMSFASPGGITNSMFSNRSDTLVTSAISRPAETMTYEMFLSNGGTLSCNSNDFEDLLKLRRNESNSNNINAGDVDSLSLSSFMEISLPESAKLTANECLEELSSSNITLSMIRNLENDLPKDLETPDSSPIKRLMQATSNPLSSDLLPDFDKSWSMDGAGGDLSLSNYFHFDSQRSIPETETEVSYQAIIEDGTLDFSSRLNLFTELTPTPTISQSRK